MKTIVVTSQKGGSGKTTLATHLAVEVERAGDGPAWLIDTDKQGTLSLWHERRESDTPQASITAQTIAALSEHGRIAQTFVADRVPYAVAMTGGRTAPELGAKTPAAEEIPRRVAGCEIILS